MKTSYKNRMLRRAHRRRAGMTLMEIMIVLVLVGMLATGIGVALMPQLERGRVRDTEKSVQIVRSAVQMYRLDSPRACPDMRTLVNEGFVDSSKSTVDAWGNEFVIQCDRNEVSVISPGADGQLGTEDDIR